MKTFKCEVSYSVKMFRKNSYMTFKQIAFVEAEDKEEAMLALFPVTIETESTPLINVFGLGLTREVAKDGVYITGVEEVIE